MLISNITEVKTYLPIGVGNDFNRLKPHLANAEANYIAKLLGTSMYQELAAYYASLPLDTSGDADVEEQRAIVNTLLEKCQDAICHLAYFSGFDMLNVSISDAGISRTETQSQKSLYKYQEDNLKEYFKTNGFNRLDDILLYLEENINYFSGFEASTNYTVMKQAIIPSTQVFHSIYFIAGSRLTFLRLVPHMKVVEDTAIANLLGETDYAYIKTEMAKDEPAAKVTAILPYLRTPLAYLSAAMLMEESGAELGDKGLFFEGITAGNTDNRDRKATEIDRVAALVKRTRAIGNNYIEKLKAYLVDNAASWENYSAQTGPVYNRDNTSKKTFWA